jgi:photosystem II stability/assembly factor-like uncharacterized protein
MKKLYILFLIGAAAWGCGDKDRYLVTQLPAEPAINADVKVLIKDNSLNAVRIDQGGVIRGLTMDNFFTTSDAFKSFTYAPYSVPAASRLTPYSYDSNAVCVAAGTVLAPTVYYSTDFGSSWSNVTLNAASFFPSISLAGYNTTELVNVAYIDNDYLMLTYQQRSVANADSRKFYKLNIKTQKAYRVSYFDDAYYPVDVKFTDNKTGYVLMYKTSKYSSYISKTLDTGRTWSEPVVITDRVLHGLQAGIKGSLCATENFGNAYLSTDSGFTWKKPAIDQKLTAAHMVTQNVIYGVTAESLVKSTDTGVTWNTVSDAGAEYINMKNLHFADNDNGVMYGGQKLYLTADGGVTWKVLLYPYKYVTED